MQVITAGTGSDLSRKVWVTASKGDTELSIFNLRQVFTLK